jgi:hypothetical protein
VEKEIKGLYRLNWTAVFFLALYRAKALLIDAFARPNPRATVHTSGFVRHRKVFCPLRQKSNSHSPHLKEKNKQAN